MKKSTIITIIVAVAIIIIGGFLACKYSLVSNWMGKNTEENTQGNIETADWKTYRNEEYGFEIKYPNDWHFGMAKSNSPIFNFSKESTDVSIPQHSGATLISILPNGVPTEGASGQSKKVTEDLTKASEGNVMEFYLTNSQTWGYYINFNDAPESWEDYGFVWAGVKIENLQMKEIPTETYSQFIKSGNINEADLQMIKKILSTFKFTK